MGAPQRVGQNGAFAPIGFLETQYCLNNDKNLQDNTNYYGSDTDKIILMRFYMDPIQGSN